MKKLLFLLLMSVCFLAISACGSQNNPSDTTSAMAENAAVQEKTWSEQDILAMFSDIKDPDWEYIDCVLMPDHASGRVGAVLFRNENEKTSEVAFFDADGYAQQTGTSAETADDPDFTYLGDGTVTFQLKNENGTIYHYMLTISVDGSNVKFTAEDDLPKQS